MSERHFISQTSLAPLPPAEVQGRVIMTDFNVFHNRADNSAHFAEIGSDDASDADTESYQLGFEAGKAETQSVYENTIKVMEETLGQLKSTLATKTQDIEQSHARVVLQTLEAVLPALAERVLVSEIQNVILQVAAPEISGPLTAYVHPKNEIAKSFLRKDGREDINIIERSDLSETAVHFSWDVSRVEIDPQANAQHCLDILSRALPEVNDDLAHTNSSDPSIPQNEVT